MRSHADLIADIQSQLGERSTDFDEAFLSRRLSEGLRDLSNYAPYIVRETLTTTANSKELDISDIYNLLRIEALEYRTGKTPREFRNWKQYYNNTLSMLIDFGPSADEDVYLYCAKIHKVPAVADLSGAATAIYAAGVSTINVDGLTTAGTIEADSTFTIASDSTGTRYRLTADTVLAAGAGDLVFTPVLAEAIAENDVVTFDNSTLTEELELLLIDLVAANAAISKATSYIGKVNIGRVPFQEWLAWWQNKLTVTRRELKRIKKRTAYQTYPRV